jgi:hypothetical protein
MRCKFKHSSARSARLMVSVDGVSITTSSAVQAGQTNQVLLHGQVTQIKRSARPGMGNTSVIPWERGDHVDTAA